MMDDAQRQKMERDLRDRNDKSSGNKSGKN